MLARLTFAERCWNHFTGGYVSHLTRYVLIAGLAWLLFYVIFRRPMLRRKIQEALPGFTNIRREVLYSLCSFAIFAGMGVLIFVMRKQGWTQLYSPPDKYGWGYFWFTVVAMIFIHDAWFYWTHRLMHHPKLFPYFHRVHHLSHNPSPWAAFSFHPLEAIVESIIFPLTVLVLPMHLMAAGPWLLYMTIMNVFGHLGYELLPRGFTRHWLWRWHNTSVHHNMHHRHSRYNYGLYFNIWDRLMGTNHPRYDEEYDRVTQASPAGAKADAPSSRAPSGDQRPEVASSLPGKPSMN